MFFSLCPSLCGRLFLSLTLLFKPLLPRLLESKLLSFHLLAPYLCHSGSFSLGSDSSSFLLGLLDALELRQPGGLSSLSSLLSLPLFFLKLLAPGTGIFLSFGSPECSILLA